MAQVAHLRLVVLALFFTAAVMLVIGRLAFLAAFSQSPTSRDGAAALVPLRADVTDRNGVPLARTIDAWSVGVQPKNVIGDKAELARRLATIFPERDATWFYTRLKMDAAFTYLATRALPAQVSAVNALGEPGIKFGREPQRLYPQSSMAAHALGFLDIDGHGQRGMERFLEERLTDPATRDAPVALSIDARVQAAMESELGQAMVAFGARGAAGLVLDVDTGEIVAMASLPVFNPNRIKGSTADMQRNNVTQSVYELGSAFKPITMATAIESGVVTNMARRFDATAPLQVGRFRIKDDHAQNRWLNIPETLIHSSNIATARIAEEIGPERLQATFRALDFDKRPAIELREKQKSLWPQYWARTTTMTTAFGHGIAVTPLHLASAYAALVNGGIFRPATLLKVAPGQAVAGKRVYSQATSDRLRQLLRLIVTQGTGKKAEAPGYRVGGKTGTAEVPGRGGYDKNRNVSTFAAVFPMDHPRYVVIAMVDSAQRVEANSYQTTAAYTAAPVISRVIMRTGAILGVMPDVRRDVDVSDLTPLLWHAPGEDPAAGE
ncbi:MAG: penicillin-binding protein 2 [Pseudomonadota bacterium]